MRAVPARTVLLALLLACEPSAQPPAAQAPTDPGHRPLRRVNRAELDRMFRDLTATPLRPGVDFPPDDAASGFDNHADALAMSPLFFELAEAAAGAVARDLTEVMRVPSTVTVVDGASWSPEGEGPNTVDGASFAFYTGGAARFDATFAAAGRYRVTLDARTTGSEAGPANVAVEVDGRPLASLSLEGDEASTSFDADLPAEGTLTLRFLNDAWDPATGLDRNVWIDRVSFEGPFDVAASIPSERAEALPCNLVGLDDDAARACAERIVTGLATRSWRRPLTASETTAMMDRWDVIRADGGTAFDATQFALKAIWTSPNFLFLVEPTPTATAAPVDAHTLAQRLAVLLWGSVPDAALRAAADDGSLLDPAVLEAQTRRMIADPRGEALVDDLAGQWLGIRMVATTSPDPVLFPAFTPAVRDAFAAEMRANFRAMLDDEIPFASLLTQEWSRVTDPLIDWYGLDSRASAGDTRYVNVALVGRGGWLSQGGLLTALSPPTRTSPVKRGVWVLSQLLCDEPPPPPPNVEGFPEPSATATTVRERLEAHRANPACAACHDRIDPIGFAFEGFDAVGRVRTEDGGLPIDTTAVMPDGTTLDGLTALQQHLADDPRLAACAAERVFVYAHGRDPRSLDEHALQTTVETFEALGGSFVDLLVATVLSEPFRAARAEEAP